MTTGANALTLSAGTGSVTMQNAANDFATVSVASATNVVAPRHERDRPRRLHDRGEPRAHRQRPRNRLRALSIGGATAIGAGAANNITLDDANNFGGNVAVSSGNAVRLNDVNALTLDASSFGTLTATAGGALTVNGTLTASGAGDAIVLAGTSFQNNAGAGALVPGTGRWLVWSTDPASDNRGGLVYDFKQYNATFGITPVAGDRQRLPLLGRADPDAGARRHGHQGLRRKHHRPDRQLERFGVGGHRRRHGHARDRQRRL